MKKVYWGFTIIELLWAIIIISIALLSVLWLLRVAISYTNKTRQETIAINLAREGIESIYTRRNSNWLERAWEKDKNWLCNDSNPCTSRLQWDNYRLQRLAFHTSNSNRTPYYILDGNFTSISDSLLNLPNKDDFLLQTWDFLWWISPDPAGKFYRAIIWLWLYQKNTNIVGWNNISNCTQGDDTYNWIDMNWNPFSWICGDSHPKEFRFCSRVEYEKDLRWKVELCGSITNYQE